jgi:hypothetical protein
VEKTNRIYISVLVISAFVLGITVGFWIGGGNFKRSAGLESTNRELTGTVESLGAELDREREITQRFRDRQTEERRVIEQLIETCNGAGNSVQGIIKKMEMLNGYIGWLEYRANDVGRVPIRE